MVDIKIETGNMGAMTQKISGLIVAHNEEELIEDALKSLDFCDEIVVVLDKCSDGTKKICEKYTQNLIEGAWDLEGERRNLGIEACTGPWIVELDADERVSKGLAKEIKDVVATAPKGYALIPIDNYIGNRLVTYGWAGSFGTNNAKKLFYKGCKVWGMQRVHPKLTLKGKQMQLTSPITHLIDKDINDMIDRLQRYTDWQANDWRAKGYLPKFRTSLRKSATRFYKSYWARKGYKEGRYGFLLALMAALFPLLTHLKAELETGAQNKPVSKPLPSGKKNR